MPADLQIVKETSESIESLLLAMRRAYLPVVIDDVAKHEYRLQSTLPPIDELSFVRLGMIRYRERKDIHYAMTSLFGALHGNSKPIVFLLTGDKKQTALYLGYWQKSNELDKSQEDLAAALKGFIPGTEFSTVPNPREIIQNLKNFSFVNAVLGVPSEKQAFQDEKRNAPVEYGIERLADAMTNDNYAMLIVASPVRTEQTAKYFENISSILDYAHRLTKTTEQSSWGTQSNVSYQEGSSEGGSHTEGVNNGFSENVSETPWCLKRWFKGICKFIVGGPSTTIQKGEQRGTQESDGTTWGASESKTFGFSESKNDSTTVERINHQAIFAEELLKMIKSRLKNGIGEGLWKTNVLFLSDREETVTKGGNVLRGMWAGAQSHQDPIRILQLTNVLSRVNNKVDTALTLLHSPIDDLKDHPLGEAYAGGYSWITSGELAIEANLPYYELPSLSSETIVEYGRFLPKYNEKTQIELGTLVDRNIKTDTSVWMDTFRLNRHLFVTGLTGAGKSNTVRAILLELARLGIPFLVIEPVKSEYRLLNQELAYRFKEGKSKFDHLDVFSLSGIGAEKLVLNPFSFEIKPGEDMATALISHIDRLKAVFNSSLGMYSSMPYILEEMIYKAYKNAGWNIETGKNQYFEIARSYLNLPEDSELRNLFLPTLSELALLVDEAIKGFFPDKSDYGVSLVGALKSRLNSLSRGAKGMLLNQKLSLPIETLLTRPCVIELESFADNDEKAFIMALLLSRIYEFRAGKLSGNLKHVLVIEEAHRLLSKPPQAGEYSGNSRGKSVEVFSDMLAEIRAYGQGIVIADQIPAKLIPDVIKNTDIKIVHRLMAKEDRESVGSAMNLTDKQINDLNRATPGLATVSFDGLNSAIRVQVRNVPLHTDVVPERKDSHYVEAMTEYKQNIFLAPHASDLKVDYGKYVQPSVEKANKGYWLVSRLFFIAAICENTSVLESFKKELLREDARNHYQSVFSKSELWPCVAEGAHALSKHLPILGIVPGEAGIIAASLVAFAYKWCKNEPFKPELLNFINLVKKDIPFGNKEDGNSYDYFSVLLQIFADSNNFHNVIAEALAKSTTDNWEPLQDVLNSYVNEITQKQLKGSDSIAVVHTYLRLLRCFRTDNEKLQQLSGLAYGALLKLLPESTKTIINQIVEEVEDND